MSDELPTAARVSDPGIRALYRLENRWQAWLDVEAALAEAQAELGIIPHEAAEAIAAAAQYELLDRKRIDEGRREVERLSREAEEIGVFGVPSFIVDGELFWGREHLPDIREMLARLASP